MKILLLHRYFWPDSPAYASILREIGEMWQKESHHVSVFSTQPSYRSIDRQNRRPSYEVLDGIHIRRCRLPFLAARSGLLRAIKEILFLFAAIFHLLKNRKYDIVMCSTQPPVLLAYVVGWICKLKRSSHVYHCMDIYPEIAVSAGMLRKGWRYRFAKRLDTATMRRAKRVVVLSQDMAKTCQGRGIDPEKIKVINNFELPSYEDEVPVIPEGLVRENTHHLRILFAGNLGRFQGLDTVVSAALSLGEGSWEFVFVGEGKAKEDLIHQAKPLLNRTIFFYPHQPVSVIKQVMQSFDLGIVSLSPNIIRSAYPSKVSTLLAQGCPLLVLMEKDSELASMAESEACGYTSALDSKEIVELLQSPNSILEQMSTMKDRAKSVAEKGFTKEKILPKWKAFISEW
jgi:colanic acid biosynthesis glycosyl transferase WcaI